VKTSNELKSARETPTCGGPTRADLARGVDKLQRLIDDYFPAEAANLDPEDRAGVLDVACELLERLWRWEH